MDNSQYNANYGWGNQAGSMGGHGDILYGAQLTMPTDVGPYLGNMGGRKRQQNKGPMQYAERIPSSQLGAPASQMGLNAPNPIGLLGYNPTPEERDDRKMKYPDDTESDSEETKKKPNPFVVAISSSLNSILGPVALIAKLMTATPAKAIFDLLGNIVTVFLMPIGMLLFSLLKPALLVMLKAGLSFMDWIMKDEKLNMYIEGLGNVIGGALGIIVGWIQSDKGMQEKGTTQMVGGLGQMAVSSSRMLNAEQFDQFVGLTVEEFALLNYTARDFGYSIDELGAKITTVTLPNFTPTSEGLASFSEGITGTKGSVAALLALTEAATGETGVTKNMTNMAGIILGLSTKLETVDADSLGLTGTLGFKSKIETAGDEIKSAFSQMKQDILDAGTAIRNAANGTDTTSSKANLIPNIFGIFEDTWELLTTGSIKG